MLLEIYLYFVYFRFGVHYELPLLAQSIIMIVCMTVMIQLCVRVGNEGISPIVHKSFWSK